MAGRAPPRFPSAAGAAEGLSSTRHALLQAAYSGELCLLKRLVRALDNGRGRPREAAEAAREDGVGPLHLAAGNGQLEVCGCLAEELRVDVDAADDEGMTPLAYAVICENAAVVKFLLDHGADPDKSDDIGLTPLHSAAGIGDCEMIEMLLAKGAYVDPIADEIGTPLYLANKQRKVGAMKILLDHNADAGAVINSDWISAAMGNGHSTECLKFLLEADANRNAPNGAAFRASARGGVTAPTQRFSGARGRGQMQRRRREQNIVRGEEVEVKVDPKDEQANERKISQLKSFASKAIERNDYICASAFYTKSANYGRVTKWQGLVIEKET